jgi:Cu-Zn family superoxide dismutase
MRRVLFCLAASVTSATLAAAVAPAGDIVVPMTLVDAKGVGAAIGEVVLSESPHGIVLTPRLRGLPPGVHGFHLHERASCAPAEKDGTMGAALAAGAHYDPKATGRHGLPWGDGHLGDLPALYVAADGTATYPVLAPRLARKDLPGRSLMVHAGGDNHSDHPAPLGGGAGRIACGVIP